MNLPTHIHIKYVCVESCWFKARHSTIASPLTFAHSYLKYTEACAQAVRNVVKDDLRIAAQRRSENIVKFARWEAGKQSESSALVVVGAVVADACACREC
jgi:F-type H+-transporting ATPase subunit epsilon